MNSDSDDELPSLASIFPKYQQGKRAITPVIQRSPIEDPSEQAIATRSKKTSKVGSSRRALHHKSSDVCWEQFASRSASTSSISEDGNKQRTRSTSPSQSTRTPRAQGFHSRALEATTTKLNTLPSASSSRLLSFEDTGLKVIERDPLPSTSRDGHTSTEKQSHYASVEQCADNTQMHFVQSVPGATLAKQKGNLPFQSPFEDSQAKAAAKAIADARKKRRVTIIIISDSEDDIPFTQSRSRSPSRTPSLVAEEEQPATRSDDDELAEEVSFADYSDDNGDSQFKATPAKKTVQPATQIIEIDSSDSDYDAASGVISWNPTPNKPKNIVKPSSLLLPLSPLPASNVGNIPKKGAESGLLAVPLTPAARDKSKNTESSATKGRTPATPSTRTARKNNAFVKQRDELAMQLVEELNETVFDGKLPETLIVVWNGRLNTTAGRANWKKITNKTTNTVTHKAEVELSTKVVDSEEKLKCTLSHELCHIAAWAFEKEMKPAHGPAFKSWGKKIMRVRKDIKVTTKHTYEIAYKFQWQCKNTGCGKIYGRHSKSIDPTRHACGACSGRLVRLDKSGQPIIELDDGDTGGVEGVSGARTPRKESEWSIFSKEAFKRIKAQQPGLGMTQINKIVAAEWAEVKKRRAEMTAQLESLVL